MREDGIAARQASRLLQRRTHQEVRMRSNWSFAAAVILVFVFLPACIGDLAGCLGCSEDDLDQFGGLIELVDGD